MINNTYHHSINNVSFLVYCGRKPLNLKQFIAPDDDEFVAACSLLDTFDNLFDDKYIDFEDEGLLEDPSDQED